MTIVKPEHMQKAQVFVDEYKDTSSDFVQPHRALVEQVAQLYADLDTARADARVLAEECEAHRKCFVPGSSVLAWAEMHQAMTATDASGALERNRSKE